MPSRALILDVDGTLVDTNATHVEAWHEAFAIHGYDVTPERLTVEIGKGGDKLVPAVIGEDADRRDGKKLREAHDEAFLKRAAHDSFAVFPGVRALLETARARGIRTAVATSSKNDHLDATLASAGLDLRALVDEVVTASDARESKPAPDIVVAAVERLGLDPAACTMLGDTPHDGTASRGAGVAFVAVRCGGNDDTVLRAAGARAVLQDPAELLARLDELI